MKITLSTITAGKSGDSEKNGKPFHWTIHNLTFPELSIFEQNGTPHKFTKANTFDEIAADLKAGDTIDAECEVNEKGYLSLKKISKVMSSIEPDKKGSPELPHATPQRPGQEIGLWWKELGDMIRAGKAPMNLEEPYWKQMRDVLGLHGSQIPETANVAPTTPPGGKLPHEKMDKEMVLNSIMHRLKLTSQPSALKWLTTVTKISSERLENEPEAVYNEIKAKLNWS